LEFVSCYINNIRKIQKTQFEIYGCYMKSMFINLCQIKLYLTGLYGVRKQYIGFQYGTKFAEKTVSFVYMNAFRWLRAPAALVIWVIFRLFKHRMLYVA
jgi:hypothetical protein